MDLPFRNEREVQRPAALEPFENGHIPLVRLHKCDLRWLVLSAPAARAVRAMVAAAGRDGVTLTATGTYRTLDQQLAMFAERYRPCTQAEADQLPKAQKKNWNGQWFAPAAHGERKAVRHGACRARRTTAWDVRSISRPPRRSSDGWRRTGRPMGSSTPSKVRSGTGAGCTATTFPT